MAADLPWRILLWWGERRVARSPRLGFWFGLKIERDGGADERLERRCIHGLALADVDGAADVALQAGVEEAGRVGQRGTFGEGQLDDALVGLSGADDAGVGEDGRAGRCGVVWPTSTLRRSPGRLRG